MFENVFEPRARTSEALLVTPLRDLSRAVDFLIDPCGLDLDRLACAPLPQAKTDDEDRENNHRSEE